MSVKESSEHEGYLLCVDDDVQIRERLARYLRANNFLVALAKDASDARELLGMLRFDLIIVDVMMPGESGFSLTKYIFEQEREPVLMLTARGESSDRISGFEAGADDYLPKPFEPKELLLRISAILRRGAPERTSDSQIPNIVSLGDCRFNLLRGELTRANETLDITGAEASIISRLARSPGKPVSRQDLLSAIGGGIGERTVDVYIVRLRKKIEDDPHSPRYLKTLRGKGYMLTPD